MRSNKVNIIVRVSEGLLIRALSTKDGGAGNLWAQPLRHVYPRWQFGGIGWSLGLSESLIIIFSTFFAIVEPHRPEFPFFRLLQNTKTAFRVTQCPRIKTSQFSRTFTLPSNGM
jgi:hypothetical protein